MYDMGNLRSIQRTEARATGIWTSQYERRGAARRFGAAWSEDGSRIVAQEDTEVLVWGVERDGRLQPIACFAPHGPRLQASARARRAPRPSPPPRVPSPPRPAHSLRACLRMQHVCLAPPALPGASPALVTTADDGSARVWSLEAVENMYPARGRTRGAPTFSSMRAAGAAAARARDAAAAAVAAGAEKAAPGTEPWNFSVVAVAAGGRWLYSGEVGHLTGESIIRAWPVDGSSVRASGGAGDVTSRARPGYKNSASVAALACSPDGKLLAAYFRRHGLVILDAETFAVLGSTPVPAGGEEAAGVRAAPGAAPGAAADVLFDGKGARLALVRPRSVLLWETSALLLRPGGAGAGAGAAERVPESAAIVHRKTRSGHIEYFAWSKEDFAVSAAAFAPPDASSRLLVLQGKGLSLYEAATGARLATWRLPSPADLFGLGTRPRPPGGGGGAAGAPPADVGPTFAQRADAWAAETGRPRAARGLSVSPDGRLLAMDAYARSVQVFDATRLWGATPEQLAACFDEEQVTADLAAWFPPRFVLRFGQPVASAAFVPLAAAPGAAPRHALATAAGHELTVHELAPGSVRRLHVYQADRDLVACAAAALAPSNSPPPPPSGGPTLGIAAGDSGGTLHFLRSAAPSGPPAPAPAPQSPA
eukprot:tig00000385_g24746.t1